MRKNVPQRIRDLEFAILGVEGLCLPYNVKNHLKELKKWIDSLKIKNEG